MTRVPTVWDAGYFSLAAPMTSTTKQLAVVEEASRLGLVELLTRPPEAADSVWRDIARIHDPAYVEAVRTGEPRALAESQGFTWSPIFADSVQRIWAGHRFAVETALARGGVILHPVSGAHHAHYASGAGFCTFNYLVRPHALVDRSLVIDLDAHYGDGTDAMTQENLQVYHFDIYGGHEVVNQTEHWRGKAVCNDPEYFKALAELPALLDRVQPELVQYQAGADPFEEDPLGGIPGMTMAALKLRDNFVIGICRARQIPMVVTLAGGYVPGITEQIHLNTIRALTEDTIRALIEV